ncbi:MAG: bifunctional helix-turn-helix transcriptional regulator/alpha/beta hydrolase [Henriciella sp.]
MRYEDRLIQLAYELMLHPQKLGELDELIDQKLRSRVADDDTVLASNDSTLNDVSHFFESAYSLYEGKKSASVSKKGLLTREDNTLWVLIDSRGCITQISKLAMQAVEAPAGEALSDLLSSAEERADFDLSLRQLQNGDAPPPTVLSLPAKASDHFRQFLFEWDTTSSNQPVGVLQELKAVWDDQVGRLFAQSLKLTSIEQSICRAIVSGMSLRTLANERGRSVGTVRNQLKRMLAKLHLNSQSELICLYAGFLKFHQASLPGQRRVFELESKRQLQVFELHPNRQLAVDVWGEENAEPVLYLHPLIGGTGLTTDVKSAFSKSGRKLIMPWRPGYGASSNLQKGVTHLFEYADLLEILLDRLELDDCPVLASNGAMPYALAFAHKYPTRCRGIVLSAPAIPLTKRNQLSMMSMQLRVAAYLAKHSEGIFKHYLRSTINAVEAGHEEAIGKRFFEKSAADQEFSESPEFRKIVVDALGYSFIDGYDGALHDFLLNRENWLDHIKGLETPIHMIFGQQDVQHAPALIKAFASTFKNAAYEIVPDAGSLVFFQSPIRIVRAIERLAAFASPGEEER